MKLSIILNKKTYSVESEEQFDGSNINELAEQFKGLLVSAGFHPCNVDEILNTDYQWFTQAEIDNNMQGHKKYNYTDPDHPMYLAQEEDYMKKYNEGYAKGWSEANHQEKVEQFQNDLYRQHDSDLF